MPAPKVGIRSSWYARKYCRPVIADVMLGSAGARRCSIAHAAERIIRFNPPGRYGFSIPAIGGPHIATIFAHSLCWCIHFHFARIAVEASKRRRSTPCYPSPRRNLAPLRMAARIALHCASIRIRNLEGLPFFSAPLERFSLKKPPLSITYHSCF